MPMTTERLPPVRREKCAVLVAVPGAIEPSCDEALNELQRRGYAVRRARGDSQFDLDRSQIAACSLDDGFEESFWIDPDIVLHPDDVERLRAHALPLVGAIYAVQSARSLACRMMPGTREVVLGKGGRLIEILYGAAGFLSIRREVYQGSERRFAPPRGDARLEGPCPFGRKDNPLAV